MSHALPSLIHIPPLLKQPDTALPSIPHHSSLHCNHSELLSCASKMTASSSCLLGDGLSTINGKPYLCKDFYGRRLLHSSSLPSLGSALLGNGKALADDQGVSSSGMSYSRFLEYLDKDRVKKVDLFENGTIAIVEVVSPELGNRVQRVRVQLPGLSQELLQKFREKNIDLQLIILKKNLALSFLT
ncbi:unnamed protein product [Linum tenue]|uniref:Peptidase M41 FtsH extracellular domain-containing protein n=1 Tax=Linum tenue TaxID=586396 RepID=A0AAV0NSE2_9ROSI|nr:unnamed protein product [Linum tenue]